MLGLEVAGCGGTTADLGSVGAERKRVDWALGEKAQGMLTALAGLVWQCGMAMMARGLETWASVEGARRLWGFGWKSAVCVGEKRKRNIMKGFWV